jgi:hypothetical protein
VPIILHSFGYLLEPNGEISMHSWQREVILRGTLGTVFSLEPKWKCQYRKLPGIPKTLKPSETLGTTIIVNWRNWFGGCFYVRWC